MSDSPEEPARAITLALEEAGVAPRDIQYVNLHGTSTEMNDRVETRALKLALGDAGERIPMSGLKSQIGHAQGACGSASLAATVIAMEHGKIPPTINLEVPDPECDLDYVPDVDRSAQHRARDLQLCRIRIEKFCPGVRKSQEARLPDVSASGEVRLAAAEDGTCRGTCSSPALKSRFLSGISELP